MQISRLYKHTTLSMKKYILILLISCFATIAKSQGIITTIAGIGTESDTGDNGLAVNAGLDGPTSITLDGAGNYYIADTYNNRIRKVNASGIITTIAGNDTAGYNGDNILAVNAQLNYPI